MYGRPKFLLFLLRVSMGWIFFYSGLSKILSGNWTAKAYLENAQTFSNLYAWFASPANIGWVDFVNQWGQLLIGAALILGVFVRSASFGGILLMILYYFPVLDFPAVGEHAFLVDEHVIYALVLMLLIRFKAGSFYSLRSPFG